MVPKQLIAKSLADGLTPVEASQEHGVSPSYISQLLADTNFKILIEQCKDVEELTDAEAEELKERKELHKVLDDSYDAIEELALGKMIDQLGKGLITKPTDILNVLKVANSANRKADKRNDIAAEQGGNTIVQLNLGPVLLNQAKAVQTVVNERNEVIEVGNQTIVNKPKAGVIQELNELKEQAKLGALPTDIVASDL